MAAAPPRFTLICYALSQTSRSVPAQIPVYLVPLAEVTPDTEVEKTMFVDLGRLKAFTGSQNYAIPGGIDLADFRSVVVWCEQFNVLISPATISPVTPISGVKFIGTGGTDG